MHESEHYNYLKVTLSQQIYTWFLSSAKEL